MKTLYEITEDYRQLLDLAQEGDIEEGVIQDTIASIGLDSDLEEKVENYWHVIDELDASNDRINEEIKRLRARMRSQNNNIVKMKDALRDGLEYIGVEKIKTDKATIWIQNNPIGVEIIDESKIPKRFYEEVSPKLNKRELKSYLEEHPDEEFSGAALRQTRSIRKR